MQKTCEALLIESLGEALETMAFMAVMPPEESADALRPMQAVRARMTFSGPAKGEVEVMGGPVFVQMLAANVLGVDESDPEAVQKGVDALQELVNTTCGILLPQLATPENDQFDVSLPESQEVDEAAWEAFVHEGATELDVEGELVAVRLRMEE